MIDLLAGDSSLDYSAVVTPVLGIGFDILYSTGYTDAEDTATKISTTISLMDQILTQAGIVGDFNPDSLSGDDWTEMQNLVDLVEQLGLYLDPLFDTGPDPVV